MVRKAEKTDLPALARLGCQLWPNHTAEEMMADFAEIMERDTAFFLGFAEEMPVGFAQCQLRRDYVEGTDSSPVGYLEGIFVAEGHRKRGLAAALLAACENWAREQGCKEFASDCELDNTASLQFHLSLGFHEANRIICFSKRL